MKRASYSRNIAAALLTVLLALPALAELQVKSFEAGLFDKDHVALDDGERLLGAETVKATREIPAKLGVKFGIRFTLAGKNPASGNQVKYFYLTPGVVGPDGVRHDKYEVVQSLSATAPYHMIAFEFTKDYEIVPGEWLMMVFQGDRLLLKESFAVGIDESVLPYPPATQPKTLDSVIEVAR